MRDLPGTPVLPTSVEEAVRLGAGNARVAGDSPGARVSVLPLPSLPPLPPMSEPEARAWATLQAVLDPEVPALSVVDLGIVREVLHDAATGALMVVLTPTYSGCPATEAIEQAVRQALGEAGFERIDTPLRRAPAWTTDWITPEGRAKLKAYGIAPPAHVVPVEADGRPGAVPIRFVRRSTTVGSSNASAAEAVSCPRCDSPDTERLSAFGTTACKSLWRCRACREPFEHFKPI